MPELETRKDVIDYIEDRVENMLARPKMYFREPEALVVVVHEYALLLAQLRGTLNEATQKVSSPLTFYGMGLACGFAKIGNNALQPIPELTPELIEKVRIWFDSLPPSGLERLAEEGGDGTGT